MNFWWVHFMVLHPCKHSSWYKVRFSPFIRFKLDDWELNPSLNFSLNKQCNFFQLCNIHSCIPWYDFKISAWRPSIRLEIVPTCPFRDLVALRWFRHSDFYNPLSTGTKDPNILTESVLIDLIYNLWLMPKTIFFCFNLTVAVNSFPYTAVTSCFLVIKGLVG